MDFTLHPELMIRVLPIIGSGILCTFLVTGMIIASIRLLNNLSY